MRKPIGGVTGAPATPVTTTIIAFETPDDNPNMKFPEWASLAAGGQDTGVPRPCRCAMAEIVVVAYQQF